MTASSSATARILAFAVLLLSLAPLGSFYVLFCSITGKVVVENVAGGGKAGIVVDHQQDPTAGEAGTAAAVFISMVGGGGGGGADMAHHRVLLQDSNATLEEIWSAILSSSHYYYPPWNGGAAGALAAAVFPIPEKAAVAQQLTILLPWLISLFFGIVLPAVVSIVSFLWGCRMRRQQQQQQGTDASASTTTLATLEKRRLRLERKLRYYTKILNRRDGVVLLGDDNDDNGPRLQEEDEKEERNSITTIIPKLQNVSTSSEETFITEEEETEESSSSSLDNTMDDDDDDTILLQFKLPRPGMALPSDSSSHNSSKPRLAASAAEVPSDYYRIIKTESCAICLHPYKPGDAVTWSPNPNCIHCFHEKCIVTWLIRKPSKQQACPCCRQNFIRPQFSHHAPGDGAAAAQQRQRRLTRPWMSRQHPYY